MRRQRSRSSRSSGPRTRLPGDETELLRHRAWIDGPEFLSHFAHGTLVLLSGALIWLVGLVAAASMFILGPYVNSPAFVIGALGVAWTFGAARRKALQVDRIYGTTGRAFSIPSEYYTSRLRGHFRLVSDWRFHIASSVPIFLIFLFLAILAFFHYPVELGGAVQGSFRPYVFSPDLYSSENGSKAFALVAGFAVPIAAAFGTALWLVSTELWLVKGLQVLPVPPLPEAIRIALRPVADFHVTVAIEWTVGATFFFIMFWRSPDVMSISAMAFLILVGICEFVFPQVIMHRIVLDAHQRACAIALDGWSEARRKGPISKESTAELLSVLSTVSSTPAYWVYGSGGILQWVLAQAVAVAALIWQIRAA